MGAATNVQRGLAEGPCLTAHHDTPPADKEIRVYLARATTGPGAGQVGRSGVEAAKPVVSTSEPAEQGLEPTPGQYLKTANTRCV